MRLFFIPFLLITTTVFAQKSSVLTDDIALKLSEKPMHCIPTEFPNKTAHIINSEEEVLLSPKDLHPSFFGCLDWHSSVHGHWMLVRLLKTHPNLSNAKEIEALLNQSFSAEKIKKEADYFTTYQLAKTYERTYGWAWLLKLDEELTTWDDKRAEKWHKNLQPLTHKILMMWKEYLPKQTYPNRTGVHPNTAFALAFAIDWARANEDKLFENQLIEKSKYFYLQDKNTPAYLEPDGSDFFSPSLEIADLMRRVLPEKKYTKWLNKFYKEKSLKNIEQIPIVSDINDYQTVHLVGLSFSKAWCMKGIANSLPQNHPLKERFSKTADKFLENALPLLFQGNYGGDHWLASFAVYALGE